VYQQAIGKETLLEELLEEMKEKVDEENA